MDKNVLPSTLIDLKSCDRSFRDEVNERSGENVGLCCHCRTSAGGCPYVKAMDYHPHAVFRLVQLGLRKEALESSTMWICVSCNTCSIQCPAAIDIPAIMHALRHMAMEEGVKIAQPEIVKFHEENAQPAETGPYALKEGQNLDPSFFGDSRSCLWSKGVEDLVPTASSRSHASAQI